ncbi:cation:proton antiporter regulatory subunit [Albibacterium bauzanense]|uniref:Potassium/proton antiporter regulatory subunit (CPA2 family) n=1 Tax=Albibacterium bauzanense TaxID=653929 RepID=A0A4R1LWR3_9SPHI|nr:cation:proton antiporter regulatory subunit [Albibacterium bauzanense]TCK83237.1 potassium/proton antiporter regulatory subunit (CPA2 family) [Albibacterium bauzanense]
MSNVKETDLIGIGKKYQLETSYGDNVVIVIHDDGRRELYNYDEAENESRCVLTLNDEESRQVAGIIGGLSYKPKALETIEVALDDLMIEWYKVPNESKAITKTIGELEVRKMTGASIIAAINQDETIINPGPDYIISSGITLIVAGKRNHIKLLKQILLDK